MDNHENKTHYLIIIAVFAAIVLGLSLINLLHRPPDILMSERRIRETRPRFNFETVVSGDFMSDFESYAADRFPFREGFRVLQAATVFGAFLQTDNDGIYFDSHGIGSFQALDEESVMLLADKIKAVSESLESQNIFYAFIPDKSIFANRVMPGFDYSLAERILTQRLDSDGFTFIPLVSALEADSFYRTDLHWCQLNISGVLYALGNAMGFEVSLEQFTKRYAGQFRGGYAGQFALPVQSESLYFLYSPHIRAFYMNVGLREFEEGPVYDLQMFHGIDPYDIFLRGAQPLILLKNENAQTDRSLYVFRDSFGSSLAPILASVYSRVTLIDFRFIDLRTLNMLVDFEDDADVLFLYSSGIMNNSDMLLVPLP
ncbi:MAG: DHHW family protein [Oscillospiraceae bacterium]|nr:DHHW family protein [Oscillospiraceae bacterium]